MWWKKWFSTTGNKDNSPQKTREVAIVAKCIGCGQCAQGCPLKVKMKLPIKDK